MTDDEKADYIQKRLTEKDVKKWHAGVCSRHVRKLMKEVQTDEIQIWGGDDGPEPVSVIVH